MAEEEIENSAITQPHVTHTGRAAHLDGRRGNGGARTGAGRKPKPKELSLLVQAYAVLDRAQLPAVQAVVALLKSRRAMVRLTAAKIILAKRIPDVTQDTAPKESSTTYNITTYNGLTEDRLFELVSSRFNNRLPTQSA